MKLTLLALSLLSLTSAKRVEYAQLVQEVNAAGPSWHAALASDIDYDNDALLFMQASGSANQDTIIEAELQPVRRPRALQQLLSNMPAVAKSTSFPASLDLRVKFARCRSLKIIRNQASCASCWSFAAMNSISDSYCISKTTSVKTNERFFSPQDSLECCATCYADPKKPCNGGYLYQAFKHAKTDGVVTGDTFSSSVLCKPYYLPEDFVGVAPNPNCNKACNLNSPVKSYLEDKMKITDFVYGKGVDDMVRILNTIGSIAVTMSVYRDLYVYKSGVYSHTYGSYLGGHAVKIVGYGTENGTPYWLVANSWGASWGERGFFKIKKGTNESDIEAGYVFAATFK